MCFFFPVYSLNIRYGVALVGVRPAELPEFYEDTILLNPGPRHIMKKDDTCYYMSITKEENSAFVVHQNQNNQTDPQKEQGEAIPQKLLTRTYFVKHRNYKANEKVFISFPWICKFISHLKTLLRFRSMQLILLHALRVKSVQLFGSRNIKNFYFFLHSVCFNKMNMLCKVWVLYVALCAFPRRTLSQNWCSIHVDIGIDRELLFKVWSIASLLSGEWNFLEWSRSRKKFN